MPFGPLGIHSSVVHMITPQHVYTWTVLIPLSLLNFVNLISITLLLPGFGNQRMCSVPKIERYHILFATCNPQCNPLCDKRQVPHVLVWPDHC